MSFSQAWDDQYRAAAHLSVWPWSDLVSMVHRHAAPRSGFTRVLELGCGAGANLPFFRALGVDVHAIDGSPAIIARLREAFPDMANRLAVADFTHDLGVDGPFDLIVDRCAMPHNDVASLQAGLRLVAAALRPGGRFLCTDWFATDHEGASLGHPVDAHTRANFPETSDLHGIGPIQFFDAAHLTSLMADVGLELAVLEHKTSEIQRPAPVTRRAWWNFVAEKPPA